MHGELTQGTRFSNSSRIPQQVAVVDEQFRAAIACTGLAPSPESLLFQEK
jgi:hypothetical protein